MKRIVIASNNRHKVEEIKDILNNADIRVLSLAQAGWTGEIEETGETLAENALIKARAVRSKIKNAVIIADDTGLEVDYLAKAPGVYSARFAGPGCSFTDNNKKLIKLMRGVRKNERGALFRTVIAIIYPDGKEELAQGSIRGEIAGTVSGKKGFGYDPVFYLPKMKKTFAQLDLKQKNRVSHRQKAVKNAWKMILKSSKA
jgi:XTP/dITP diphosphohydrolase